MLFTKLFCFILVKHCSNLVSPSKSVITDSKVKELNTSSYIDNLESDYIDTISFEPRGYYSTNNIIIYSDATSKEMNTVTSPKFLSPLQ